MPAVRYPRSDGRDGVLASRVGVGGPRRPADSISRSAENINITPGINDGRHRSEQRGGRDRRRGGCSRCAVGRDEVGGGIVGDTGSDCGSENRRRRRRGAGQRARRGSCAAPALRERAPRLRARCPALPPGRRDLRRFRPAAGRGGGRPLLGQRAVRLRGDHLRRRGKRALLPNSTSPSWNSSPGRRSTSAIRSSTGPTRSRPRRRRSKASSGRCSNSTA